jgi:hypothetical protein
MLSKKTINEHAAIFMSRLLPSPKKSASKKNIGVKGDWTLLPVNLLKRKKTAVPAAKAKSAIPNNT